MRTRVLNWIRDYATGKRYSRRTVTADHTLVRVDVGQIIDNLGASGTVVVTLPQNAQKGDCFTFVVKAAQELRVTPGAAGAVFINGAKQTDNKYISADDEAESVMLVADGNGDWDAIHTVGTWTVQG